MWGQCVQYVICQYTCVDRQEEKEPEDDKEDSGLL